MSVIYEPCSTPTIYYVGCTPFDGGVACRYDE
jgi:hypothetical protein